MSSFDKNTSRVMGGQLEVKTRVIALFCFGFKLGEMRVCICVDRNHPTERGFNNQQKKEGRAIKGIFLITQEQVKSDPTWENKLPRPSRAVRAEYGHTAAESWVEGVVAICGHSMLVTSIKIFSVVTLPYNKRSLLSDILFT